MIAVATLLASYTGYQSERRHAILAPLCVMAVPLYDMITRDPDSPAQRQKPLRRPTRTTSRIGWSIWG